MTEVTGAGPSRDADPDDWKTPEIVIGLAVDLALLAFAGLVFLVNASSACLMAVPRPDHYARAYAASESFLLLGALFAVFALGVGLRQGPSKALRASVWAAGAAECLGNSLLILSLIQPNAMCGLWPFM